MKKLLEHVMVNVWHFEKTSVDKKSAVNDVVQLEPVNLTVAKNFELLIMFKISASSYRN